MMEPFTKGNVAAMAERAALEIEGLRRANEKLTAKADAYDAITTILGLLPQRPMYASEDMASKLRRRAAELREPDEEAGDGA